MEKPFEPDFIPSDEERATLLKAAGTKDDHKGHDVVCVYDHTFVDVEKSGLGNTFQNRMVKILTEKGAAENSVLRFDYDPQSTLIRLKGLRVHRADGTVQDVDMADFVDCQQPQRSMFWAPRMKVFSVPRLEVGDGLEYTFYSKGFTVAYLDGISPHDPREEDIIPPMEGIFYEVFVFEEDVPVKSKKYVVSLEAGTPLHFGIYNGECVSSSIFDKDRVSYAFEKKDLEAVKPEPRMHAREEVLTKVVLTTLESWEEKSRWFFNANEGQFDADEAVCAKVAEIIKGRETLEDKARALNHWVAQCIRYIGYSVAKGEGYTVHPGNMIFHERGGVCKESAGMLVTMCRAAGLTSYVALTQSGAKVESIPADQFNHCVTAVKRPDGSYLMLDPTWAIFSTEMFCSAEQEQNYLIGSPEGETLMARPFSPAEESPLDVTLQTSLDADGTLEGRIAIHAKGRSDTNLRRVLGLGASTEIGPHLQKLVSAFSPETELEWFRHSDPRDFYKDTEIEIRFKAPRYATVRNGSLVFPLPAAKFFDSPLLLRHLEIAKPQERKFAAMSWYTQRATVNETLSLPKGYSPVLRPFKTSFDSEIISFEGKVDSEGDKITALESISFKHRNITTDKYPDFRKGVDKIKNLSDRFWIAKQSV